VTATADIPRTRQQRMLQLAIKNVAEVRDKPAQVKDIYGGLCHKFPVLVRSCGLCQALAFVEAKTESKDQHRQTAYKLLRNHILTVLREENLVESAVTAEQLREVLAELDMRRYTLATRVLLRAWVFYKRLAEAVLGVESSQGAEVG